MVHLLKLAVGVRDIAHLRELQARRALVAPPLRHQTRRMPRQVAEITEGGSIYWVIQGAVAVRQRVLEIIEDAWDDGTACAGLVLDETLVPVVPRLVRAFQGWRYLQPADAPADVRQGRQTADGLPLELQRDLAALCLL
jgi:hypothetical protein